MPYSELTVRNVERVEVSAPMLSGGTAWRNVTIKTADDLRLTVCAYAANNAAVPVDVGTGARGNVGTVLDTSRRASYDRVQLARSVLFSLLDDAQTSDVLTDTERAALQTVLTASEPLDGGTR